MIERPVVKLIAGAGIEPAHFRLMRPVPSHLAPLQNAHGFAERTQPHVTTRSPRNFPLESKSARARSCVRIKWHGVSVLPRARGVLETLLRKLAPAVLWVSENWCGQPDLHRHPLIGTQASCS